MDKRVHGVKLDVLNGVVMPCLVKSSRPSKRHLVIVGEYSDMGDVVESFANKHKQQVVKDKIVFTRISQKATVVFANGDEYDFMYGRNIGDSMRGRRFESIILV